MEHMTPHQLDAIVDRHFQAEAAEDLEAILATYSDDIVFDVAGMPDVLCGKPAIAAFYAQLFSDLGTEAVKPLCRRYGPCFVVDDALFECRAIGRPFGFEGRGRRVSFRLLHVFDVREGRICRETVWLDIGALQRQLA